MFETVVMVALVILAVIIGLLVVIVIGIHVEDSRGSITDRPPGLMATGTRRILGLSVDHTACRYVTNPQHACPLCQRAYIGPRVP
jgi:hypothetical protein